MCICKKYRLELKGGLNIQSQTGRLRKRLEGLNAIYNILKRSKFVASQD